MGAGVINDEQLAEAIAVADDRPLPHVLDELGFASEKLVAADGSRVDGAFRSSISARTTSTRTRRSS